MEVESWKLKEKNSDMRDELFYFTTKTMRAVRADLPLDFQIDVFMENSDSRQKMSEQNIPDGFDYEGMIYRPPKESDSILIQATLGCSHNLCTFCASYRGIRFRLKDQEILEQDLLFASHYCKRQDRVFILDGNALVMPTSRWEWLLEKIQSDLPWVKGVASFAMARDIRDKSDEELLRLRKLGLDRLYVGIESGDSEVLKDVQKGVSPEEIAENCLRAKKAGMELRVTVLLGIVHPARSFSHAKTTGELLSKIQPDEVAVMTLLPQPGAPMTEEIAMGLKDFPDSKTCLQELENLLKHTEMEKGLFDYTHASGYLSFKLKMPEEKGRGLELIGEALEKNLGVRPEFSRRI